MNISSYTESGLVWLDWLMITAYVVGVLGLGWYYSRRQKDTSEYFIGTGKMNPILIGISLFATLISTASYLSKPGEVIKHGPILFTGLIFSIPLSYVIVGYWLVPKLMKQRITSAYELLEARLGVGIRLLGAIMFILLRIVWMSLLVYFCAVALTVIVGLDASWTPLMVVIIGIIAITYTSLGGLFAVVYTDLAQFCLLTGGAVITVLIISIESGGLSWWPTTWVSTWDTQPIFSFDPHVRVSLIGAIISGAVWKVCMAGGDQLPIQRFMATQDARAARRPYLVNSLVTLIVVFVLVVLGFALLGYFSTNPQLLPPDLDLIDDADKIFPFYIANHLPMGIAGLVVAAMLAAGMSSLDSGINSITAVVMTDFLDRFGLKPKSEKKHVLCAKGITFGAGIIVVIASMYMKYMPGNFVEMTMRLANLLLPQNFGLFFMVFFVPFATPLGALMGVIYGFTASLMFSFWHIFTGLTPLSPQYVGATGMVMNIVVACLVSYFGPRSANKKASTITGLLLFGVLIIFVILAISSAG